MMGLEVNGDVAPGGESPLRDGVDNRLARNLGKDYIGAWIAPPFAREGNRPMHQGSLKFVRRAARPFRRALERLQAILDKGLGRDVQRHIDSMICRPISSGAEVITQLERIYAMRPELHQAFPDGALSDDFWWWANVEGFFEHDELQFSLAPIPPIRLVRHFGYEKTAQNFAWTGALHYSILQQLLKKHEHSFNDMKAVLDFGCGAGRLGRLFAKGAGQQRYIGCDIATSSIQYLRRTMGFGEFHVGYLQPPLPFADASLDAIFSISVFTHLKKAAMHRWIAEFHRILKPGGVVLQTTLGRKAMYRCHSEPFGWRKFIAVSDEKFQHLEREFAATGFSWVPHSIDVDANDDYGIAFQTEQYIAKEWTRGFDLLEVAPAAIDDWQDLVLLRKPSNGDKVTPILPTFAEAGLAAPERVALQVPKKAVVGSSFEAKATATGGTDVRYRFSIQKNGWQPLHFDWQREPSRTIFATAAGLIRVEVEAVSGPGFHLAPQVIACEDMIVEAVA